VEVAAAENGGAAEAGETAEAGAWAAVERFHQG